MNRVIWIACVLVVLLCGLAAAAAPMVWSLTIATADDATELAGCRSVTVDFEAGEVVGELYDGRTVVTSLEPGDVLTIAGESL